MRAGRGALGERSAGTIKRYSGQSICPIHRRRSHAQKLKLPQGVGARAAWPGAKRSQRKTSAFPAWQAMHVSQVSPSLLALSPCSVFSPITFHILQQCRIVVTVHECVLFPVKCWGSLQLRCGRARPQCLHMAGDIDGPLSDDAADKSTSRGLWNERHTKVLLGLNAMHHKPNSSPAHT